MAPVTKSGTAYDPSAVERVEWLAQRDLGASVPEAEPRADEVSPGSPGTSARGGWRAGEPDSAGHWTRFLRDAHPPRFRAPGGVEVTEVDDDTEAFGATAAFGLHLPARTEKALASLPSRPGWRCYLARAGDAPPAAAATFADGAIVLLAIDATAEAGRRGGARAALLHRVIGDSLETGARLIGARVDEEAEDRDDAVAGLLLAGFKQAYRCPEWVDAGLPAS